MISLETISINPLKISDAIALNRLMVSNKMHFQIYLPVTVSENKTLSETKAYIERKSKENETKNTLTFAINELVTNNLIGLIIIKKIDFKKRQGEFAYGIGKNFEGKGYMSMAVKKVIQYASEKLNLKTIQIITHKTNIGSRRIAEKNGFIWQRTLKNEFTPPKGKPMDMELYELYL